MGQSTQNIACDSFGIQFIAVTERTFGEPCRPFELIKTYQWTYEEMKRAFKYNLERYLTYGGYPGAVTFERRL